MMDMAKLGEKVKIFQRRATQKVLQQMGMADKTADDMNDHTYQNFNALGSFTGQLKATIQAADTTIEKMCTAQTHLAGQVQSYLHSELSGDTDLPPGELYDFFNSSHVPDAQMHAVLLQEVAEKFYSACSEIGNQFLRSLVNRLDDAVIKPISKDEEFNIITKDLMEEKKKAILDYDSYRRLASTSSPGEQEKNDNKMRLAKEKLDNASRRLAEHIQQRNAIRCKVLVHGILTAMQQYHTFYTAAAETLKETAQAIKPLLDVYQLSENQLLSIVNLDNLKGSGKIQKLSSAELLFDEYNKPPKPTPPAKPSHHAAPRHVSPQPPDNQLNEMMQQSIAGMKKPATTPYAKPSAPMNAQTKPQPPIPQGSPTSNNGGLNSSNGGIQNSPLGSSNGGLSSSGNQGNPPPAPKTNLLDDLDDWGASSGPNAAPPANADILDLGGLHPTAPPSTSPPPAAAASSLFDNDLLAGLGSTLPSNAPPFTPPLQPNPLQPIKPGNSPTTAKASTFPPGSVFSIPPTPPKPPSHSQAKPPPQFPGFGFEMFGAPPQATPATQQPAGGFFQGQQQPPPAAAQSYVPAHQAAEQEERHELNPAITQKIQNWAERGGRQNNLRSLLSTLHEVIWVDSGWDARSLAELVTPSQVKKAYRQANMIVHPDKIQNGTVEQKLIAQRIFEALRVSYETFNKEEGQ